MAGNVVLGRATVVVSPSFKGIQKDTKRAAEGAAESLRRPLEAAGREAGSRAGKNIGEGVERGSRRPVQATANTIRKGLDRAGREGGRALSRGVEAGTKGVSTAGRAMFRALPPQATRAGREAGGTLRNAFQRSVDNGRLTNLALWVDLRRGSAREGLAAGREAARNVGTGLQSAGGRINGIWAKFKEAARRGGREAGEAAGRGVSGGVGRHATGAGRGAGRRIMGGIGGAVAGGAAAVFAPLAAAAAAAGIGRAIFKSIEEASRSEQAQGALEAVLGTASGAVLRDSRRAATTSGMSRADYMTQATTLGAQGKNYLGHEGTNLKRYVDEQFALARDMAAMSGGTTQEAIEALAAANRGEFEQIERYNMMMKVDNVTARMKKEGIEDTPEARARMQNLMLKEQADKIGITGQFEREGGSYEQSRNTAVAGMQNAFATLGEGFMPAANGLLQWINANWMPRIQGMAEGLRDFLGPALEGMGPKLLEMGSLFSPLGAAFEVLKPSLPIIGRALGQVVEALAPLAAEIAPILAEVLGQLGVILADALAAVLPGLAAILVSLGQALAPLIAAVGEVLIALVGPLGEIIGMVVEVLAPILPLLAQIFAAILPPLVQLAAWAIEALAGWLGQLIGWIAEQLRPLLAELAQDLAEDVPAALSALWSFVTQVWNSLAAFFSDMAAGLQSTWQAVCDFFGVTLPSAFQAAKDWIVGVWSGLVQFLAQAGQSILAGFNVLKDFVTVTIPNAFRDGVAWVRGVWDSFVLYLVMKWFEIQFTLNQLKHFITVTIPNAFRDGVAWVRAKWDEFTGLIGRGVDVVRGHFDKVKNLITKTLPDAFRNGVQWIGAQWAKLRRAMADPVNFVIGTVYNGGVRKMWNTVAEKVGISARLPEVKKVAFKTGGVLPGYSPGVDIHRFVSPTGGILDLSGGEAVMRPEFTRLVGGTRGVDFLNREARNGRLPWQAHSNGGVLGMPHQRFAGGGVIGGGLKWLGDTVDTVRDKAMDILSGPAEWVKSKIGGAIDRLASGVGGGQWGEMGIAAVRKLVSGLASKASEWVGGMVPGFLPGGPIPAGKSGPLGSTWKSLWASVGPMARSLGLRMTSNYRPGARTAGYGSPSRHGMGKAVDIAGPAPAMAAMTRWLDAVHGPSLYELIYTPLNGIASRYRGRRYRETNPTTNRMHNNHLHASVFDQGGYLEPGLSAVGNFTGKQEPVFTASQWSSIHTLARRGMTAGMPDTVVLVDRDGSILARTEVVAEAAVGRRSGAVAGW